MIKKCFPTICCVLICFCFIHFCGSIFRPQVADSTLSQIESFHSLPHHSVDAIVFGSSHAWKGFDTPYLYDKYDINAYNYGCNWQHINTTLLFIKDALKTQSPKYIFIETFKINEPILDHDIDGEIYYTTAIPNSKDKLQYLKQSLGNNLGRWICYYEPFFAFHSNWNDISEKSFTDGKTKYDFVQTRGYNAVDKVYQIHMKDCSFFEQAPLTEDSLKILDEIISICTSKNIQIIFYTMPFEGEFAYHDALTEFSARNNCDYLDLFSYYQEVGFDENTDFSDDDHLNISGSQKLADFMGQFLVKKIDQSN